MLRAFARHYPLRVMPSDSSGVTVWLMGGKYGAEQSAGVDGAGSVDPLSAVRFGIPRRPRRYVDRPRLNKRLDRGAELPLTLVSAPAGSGKTALVAAWAAARRAATGRGIAWLTLEEQDVPAAMFLAVKAVSVVFLLLVGDPAVDQGFLRIGRHSRTPSA